MQHWRSRIWPPRIWPPRIWLPWVWPLVLALLMTAPLLAPGYVLSYDMVFVPDQGLRPDFFGLRSSLPRAVPSDAVVAVLSTVLPGQLVQKAVLLGILTGAGLGVVRLTRGAPLVVRLVAATAYVWNPYVAERLVLGQWAVLAGLAALPWVVLCALAVRQGRSQAWGWTVLAVGLAALSPSGGFTALAVATLLVWYPGSLAARVDLVRTTVGAAAVNAPWIIAGVLTADRAVTGEVAIQAFAARAEGHLPVVPTVLSLGGVWNADVVLDSRATWVPVVWLVVVVLVAVVGGRGLRAHLGPTATWALGVAAAVSLAIGLGGTVSASVLGAVMEAVPGAALFRDGTRYLGPLVLLESLLLGFGVERLIRHIRGVAVRTTLAAACVIAPIAVLPDLAWGAAGRLDPVDYPASWAAARNAIERDGRPGDALVLPLSPYRAFPWNDGRSGLDPAGRYFPVVTRTSEALVVDGAVVQDEDPAAARAAALYSAGDVEGLARDGVGFVVVDASLGEAVAEADSLGLDPLLGDEELAVFGVPDAVDSSVSTAHVVAVTAAWLLALVAVAAAAWAVLCRRDGRHIRGMSSRR